MSLGEQTSHWIVTHKSVANILSMQWEDVCIPTIYMYMYKLEPQEKEACKISICRSGRWACHNCRNYISLVEQTSIHLRFPDEIHEIVSPSLPTSPGLLRWKAGGFRLKRKWEVGERPCRDLWRSASGQTLSRATSKLYRDDNCDRLITQTCKSISWRLSPFVAQFLVVAWYGCCLVKLTIEFVWIQTSSLSVDNMFATSLCVTIQQEVCSPDDMKPTLQYPFILQPNSKKW